MDALEVEVSKPILLAGLGVNGSGGKEYTTVIRCSEGSSDMDGSEDQNSVLAKDVHTYVCDEETNAAKLMFTEPCALEPGTTYTSARRWAPWMPQGGARPRDRAVAAPHRAPPPPPHARPLAHLRGARARSFRQRVGRTWRVRRRRAGERGARGHRRRVHIPALEQVQQWD